MSFSPIYNLIVIIASCLDICCVLTVHNILRKFDNTQRDGFSLKTIVTVKFTTNYIKSEN